MNFFLNFVRESSTGQLTIAMYEISVTARFHGVLNDLLSKTVTLQKRP